MLITEIIESLKSLTLKHGIKISEIERECSIPKNSLASILTGKRIFPLKHKERLQEFCKAKEIALILGSSPTEKLDNKPWVNKISEFCEKKCFPPSELIQKFEGLEESLRGAEKELTDLLESVGLNKPNTAPKTEKEGKTTPKQEKGKEDAENGMGKRVIKKTYDQWLNLAREIELQDEKDEFKRELTADSTLTPRQRDMIISKLKK